MKHLCAAMHGEKICFFHAVESIDFTTTVWSNQMFDKGEVTTKIYSQYEDVLDGYQWRIQDFP